MLEHLNIQSIAKWFEKGCTSLEGKLLATHKTDQETGFYILECNDICLLSKLTDVKNHTLLERAHKQLQQIRDAGPRKDFLLAICSEFLRDGRRGVSLKMLNNEIELHSELFSKYRSDLLFHRALCLLKHDQITEALSDLYLAFESENGIQSLDKIHVQILEEIKKYLTNQESKFKEGFITTHRGLVSFEQVLQQYQAKICEFIEQQMEREKMATEQQDVVQPVPSQVESPLIELDEQCNPAWARSVRPSFYGETIKPGPRPDFSPIEAPETEPEHVFGPSYKSKLMGEDKDSDTQRSDQSAEAVDLEPLQFDEEDSPFDQHQHWKDITQVQTHVDEIICRGELALTYSVDKQQMVSVRQILNEKIIDNIFCLRAILVDKLAAQVNINTICEIFETFGTIVNIKYKDNSEKLIIEYDNSDSPRLAISYLSQVRLPHVSDQYLEFRFYKSENQRNLRICKQNQIKSSRECYFWRTTGCQAAHCKFYHNKLAKGVDYQEWMKIEQLRGFNNSNNNHVHGHSIINGSSRLVSGRGARVH